MIDNKMEIGNTDWLITISRNIVEDLIDLLENIKTIRSMKYNLEKIFSKQFRVPHYLDFEKHEIDNNADIVIIKTIYQRRINTIDGYYFYKNLKPFYIIITANFWIIDNSFLKYLSKIVYLDFSEEDNNSISNWIKLNKILRGNIKLELKNFRYLIENSVNYGKIYQISGYNFKRNVNWTESNIHEDFYYLNYKSPFSDKLSQIDKITFRTYLPKRESLNWSIDQKSRIKTEKTNVSGISKFIEIIRKLWNSNSFTYQKTLEEFFNEGDE